MNFRAKTKIEIDDSATWWPNFLTKIEGAFENMKIGEKIRAKYWWRPALRPFTFYYISSQSSAGGPLPTHPDGLTQNISIGPKIPKGAKKSKQDQKYLKGSYLCLKKDPNCAKWISLIDKIDLGWKAKYWSLFRFFRLSGSSNSTGPEFSIF